jgi:hypothetical protein
LGCEKLLLITGTPAPAPALRKKNRNGTGIDQMPFRSVPVPALIIIIFNII